MVEAEVKKNLETENQTGWDKRERTQRGINLVLVDLGGVCLFHCLFFFLLQAKFVWAEKFQMRKCLLQTACSDWHGRANCDGATPSHYIRNWLSKSWEARRVRSIPLCLLFPLLPPGSCFGFLPKSCELKEIISSLSCFVTLVLHHNYRNLRHCFILSHRWVSVPIHLPEDLCSESAQLHV